MNSSVTMHLYWAATSTLEGLAFRSPAVADDEPVPGGAAEHAVSVAFRGPLRGKLVMQVSPGLAPSIAMNMLGLDEPPEDHVQRDALREIANVVCGNVLPAIAGSAAVFDLGTPEMVGPTTAAAFAPDEPPAAETLITLEDGWLNVQLFVNSGSHS